MLSATLLTAKRIVSTSSYVPMKPKILEDDWPFQRKLTIATTILLLFRKPSILRPSHPQARFSIGMRFSRDKKWAPGIKASERQCMTYYQPLPEIVLISKQNTQPAHHLKRYLFCLLFRHKHLEALQKKFFDRCACAWISCAVSVHLHTGLYTHARTHPRKPAQWVKVQMHLYRHRFYQANSTPQHAYLARRKCAEVDAIQWWTL